MASSIILLLLLAVWLSSGVQSLAVPTSTTTMTTTTTSHGPKVLRKLVQESSEKQSLDQRGILWLEHLNLIVGDMETATKFYIDFLGMTPEREHNVKSNHFNLGQQQFHLAASNNKNDAPQRVTGSIGLTVPNLTKIRDRIDIAKKELDGTLFSVIENNGDDDSNNIMTVTCPWGNVIHLYDISIDDEYCSTEQLESTQQKMVKLHSKGGDYGTHRMAVRGKPGIRYVELKCRKGTVNSIAQFYESILGCHVTRAEDVVTVCVGPGVHLVFVEHEQLSDDEVAQMKGVHACIYISNFEEIYNTLKKMNMIWTNPRFTHLDSCDTWKEAFASRTFRFKDIISKGEKIFELEHEVRPLMHGQYMKVPPYVPN